MFIRVHTHAHMYITHIHKNIKTYIHDSGTEKVHKFAPTWLIHTCIHTYIHT